MDDSTPPPRDAPRAPGRRLAAFTAALALLALAAGAATLAWGSGQVSDFGFFAYAPLNEGAFAPGMHLLGPRQVTGWLLVVLAACAAAFWAGLRLGRRPR